MKNKIFLSSFFIIMLSIVSISLSFAQNPSDESESSNPISISLSEIKHNESVKKKFGISDFNKLINKAEQFELKQSLGIPTPDELFSHSIIMLVPKTLDESNPKSFSSEENKNNLVALLQNRHNVSEFYKAKHLSFVVAKVPVNEIFKIAQYDNVIRIGDLEKQIQFHLSTTRSTVNADPLPLNLEFDGTGIKVGVLDSGISPHDDLLPVGPTGKIIAQGLCEDLVCSETEPASSYYDRFSSSHGTSVAGIIAGKYDSGSTYSDIDFRGIAPGASLINAKMPSGLADLVDNTPIAIDWAMDKGADIINISYGTGDCEIGASNIVTTVIDEAIDEGIIVSVSAGNAGPNPKTVSDIACSYNGISVGNLDDMDLGISAIDLVQASSRGPSEGIFADGRLKPEISAPGIVNAPGADPLTIPYPLKNGTSYAAPHVSAAAALLKEQNYQFTPLEVKTALLVGANFNYTSSVRTAAEYENGGSSDSILNSYGLGVLDIGKSLTLADSGKNILSDSIVQNQIKKYKFSATQGENVKVILSWLHHPLLINGTITPQPISNLDLKIIDPSDIILNSNSLLQNNEFTVFTANNTGIHTIEVSAPFVSPFNSEPFALASTKPLSKDTFLVKQGTFTKVTGASPASQVISNIGFQPKAVILYTTGQDSEGFADGNLFSMGFSSGPSNSRSIGIHSDDNAAKSNAGRSFGTELLKILSSGDPVISAESELVSFDESGFTINWTTNDSNPTVIHYTAIGGIELENAIVSSFPAATSTGNQSVTGVGFQPDFAMFMHAASTAESSSETRGYLSYGFSASPTERSALAVTSEDRQGTMDTWSYQRTDKAIVALNEASGVLDGEADFVSFDADGFTINWVDRLKSADRIYYLALQGGQYSVGNFDKITTTSDQIISSVGFRPAGLLLASIDNVSSTSVQENNRLSFGASDGFTEGAIWSGDRDDVPDAITAKHNTSQKIITIATEQDTGTASTINANADLKSFDSTGFTLNWPTNDSAQNEIIYVAFAGEPIDLNSGLVGYWNLDENTGSIVTDISGNNNHGTLINGTSWVSGSSCIDGACLSFDGVNDHVEVPNSSSLNGMDDLTVSVWFKQAQVNGDWQWLVAKTLSQLDLGSNSYGINLNVLSVGLRGVLSIEDAGAISFGTFVPNDTNFHNVVLRYDDGDISLYLDGDLAASPLGILGNRVNPTVYPLKFGTSSDNLNYFEGVLDDIRIYDRALSPAEIRHLYLNTGMFGAQSSMAIPDLQSSQEMNSLVPEVIIIYR